MPRPVLRAIAVGYLVCLAACASVAKAAQERPTPVFPIAAVIAQVKREIAAAQTTPGASLRLNLEKVEATLVVSRTVDASGKVGIGVPILDIEVGAGGGRKVEEASTVFVELVPPRPLGTLSADDAKDFGLTAAIVETRRQLLEGLFEEPKLEPQKVVISVKFGVTRTVSGTGKVKLWVISVGGGATSSAVDANSIVLTFSRSKAP